MSESWPREPQGRELEKLTQLFKALGDSSRMKVLFQIGSSEACVSEVARKMNDDHVRTIIAQGCKHIEESFKKGSLLFQKQ